MLRLSELGILESRNALNDLPEGKLLINTVNAHSFNVAQRDEAFAEALREGDVLIPDGIPIVWACRWLGCPSQPRERIAGWDLFSFEMERLERKSGEADGSVRKMRVMFLGSSETVLEKIRERAAVDYTHLEVATYSPPYKTEFTDEDNDAMIRAVNGCRPDLLWIGMTAPKQEKWAWQHWQLLDIHCHVGTVGAVFDFYAGTVRRAPVVWQRFSLEWLHRLLSDPRRMWRRYLIGNPLFLWHIMREWLYLKHHEKNE